MIQHPLRLIAGVIPIHQEALEAWQMQFVLKLKQTEATINFAIGTCSKYLYSSANFTAWLKHYPQPII
jgi:hypothetical protein